MLTSMKIEQKLSIIFSGMGLVTALISNFITNFSVIVALVIPLIVYVATFNFVLRHPHDKKKRVLFVNSFFSFFLVWLIVWIILYNL